MDITESIRTDVETSIPDTPLLERVKEVSKENKPYLPIGDRLISVKAALESLRICEAYTAEAKLHLEQFRSLPTGDITSGFVLRKMEDAVGSAAFYFCELMRDIHIVDASAQRMYIPKAITSNQYLERKWEEWFAFARKQMYQES